MENKLKRWIMGCFIGIGISFVMNRVGGPWPLTFNLFWLLPISLIAGAFQSRWYCLAYSVPILYGVYNISSYLGLPSKWFIVPYRQLILLVGLLHMAEGIMAYWEAPKAIVPVKGYKGKEKVEGYQTYLSWLVPLFLFSYKLLFIPMFMVYSDDTTSLKPVKKFKFMGGCIFLYGACMTCLGWILVKKNLRLEVALLFMPLLHEILTLIHYKIE
ncbi:hypothetical protein CS063_06085 [Sporanaerobium hydrogeniformans]|uniref:Uncharacterized protein n=1 Tax=Sporanaerobium hydrogeniformans TaxID=3072179 RepID=A0AC61DEL4_9FIRM|nr:hypothetical protein [Sporanaerobium hydrogeniformans]PHV71258.1 hypothetical protein CS063_06085 [Sporanaerobium hydrogeniformans]